MRYLWGEGRVVNWLNIGRDGVRETAGADVGLGTGVEGCEGVDGYGDGVRVGGGRGWERGVVFVGAFET